MKIQKLKEERCKNRMPHKNKLHLLRGMAFCGDCGSIMYARIKKSGVAYICRNYFKNGNNACSSHLIYEAEIMDYVFSELENRLSEEGRLERFRLMLENECAEPEGKLSRLNKLEKQLAAKRRQQELMYADRLEGRITPDFFEKVYNLAEEKIIQIKNEIDALKHSVAYSSETEEECADAELVKKILKWLKSGAVDNHILKYFVKKVTVKEGLKGQGTVAIEFICN
jgi:DNA-directed RNA polymerase subunit M/transcription elongation factor TFIIS